MYFDLTFKGVEFRKNSPPFLDDSRLEALRFIRRKKPRLPKATPSAARPSSRKIRRFLSPPHKGFGFVGRTRGFCLRRLNNIRKVMIVKLEINNKIVKIVFNFCLANLEKES